MDQSESTADEGSSAVLFSGTAAFGTAAFGAAVSGKKKGKKKMDRLDEVFLAMIRYDKGDPRRIQHFVKVHSFARLIGRGEGLKGTELEILEAAAYVHDIGIHPAEKKYGRCDGRLQEQLGPEEAGKLLEKTGFSGKETERVKYLVGHHHTYKGIGERDLQILIEADFLVNLFEDQGSRDTIQTVREKIFHTRTGIRILEEMFLEKQDI